MQKEYDDEIGNDNKKNTASEEFIKIKHRGTIFTPDYLVKIILDQGHYIPGNINQKHIVDNSCGDGQFMIQIIDRYCSDFVSFSPDLEELKIELETYIHAIEIDEAELDVCISRCNEVAKLYGLDEVNWDFHQGNALAFSDFDGKMDFVVGNPPYVRVHNLNENFDSVKKLSFGKTGMTDLFIAFYEIGIRMLNKFGILCYITPSSFFTSLAGSNLRQYLMKNRMMESVCDLKHFQPFNATAYTTIVCLNNRKEKTTALYYEFDEKKRSPILKETFLKDEFFINGNFYFSTKENLELLKSIISHVGHSDVTVKNGFATLADKVFIGNFDFESKYLIPEIIQASIIIRRIKPY